MDRIRYPLVLLMVVSTILGLWAALRLIGWNLAVPTAGFAEFHGPIMVDGVLASLIGLERAVALRKRWPYLAPGLSGAATLALFLPNGEQWAGLLWTVSGAVLTLVFLTIYRLQPSFHGGIMVVGASLLAVGNLFWWATSQVPWMVLWWVSFLVLLIAAERLELSRVFRISPAQRAAFATGTGLLVAAPLMSLASFPDAALLAGAGLAVLGGWLLLYDIAWRNVTSPGKPRFLGVTLLSGYVWLLCAALLVILGGPTLPALYYDAFLHSVFLGFVFTMIMAHSMVILRSFLGRDIPFTTLFYVPLVLVEGTLALRVYADVVGWETLRMWAGLLNVVAIALFAVLLVGSIARGSLRWVRELFHPDFMNVQ
ncbi:MAG: hypothetical protein M1144_00215 [Candidatus Thermoplasmatota archaeon]|jgi:hypothetical protein|nr:hypothetical protein [Candidatus Thermoplasmatota archaeon]